MSCAQAHGLLAEPNFTDASDPYLAHCRFHTDKTVLRRRRQSYLSFLLATRRRKAVIKDRCDNTELPYGRERRTPESEDQRILR